MDAADRGWGEVGAPGSATGATYRRNNIIRVEAGGVSVYVHKKIAPLVAAFMNEIVRRGYRLDRVADDWGYNHRYIAGTRVLSNHSWGLAIDLNATTNPMTSDGIVHTDMPGWVVSTATRYGLYWGGNYTGIKKDPMHFEFLGTPHDADALVASLKSLSNPSEEDVMDLADSPSWSRRQPNKRFPVFIGHGEPANNSFSVLSRDNAVFMNPPFKEGRRDPASEDGIAYGMWFRRFFNTGPFYGFGEAEGSFFAVAQNGTYDLSHKS